MEPSEPATPETTGEEDDLPGEIPYCGMCGQKLPSGQTDGDYCDDCWKILGDE